MKKLISTLLALSMLAQFGTFSAFAEENYSEEEYEVTALLGESELKINDDDIYASKTGVKITFGSDVTSLSDTDVKNHITIKEAETGKELSYTVNKSEKELALDVALKVDTDYTVTVKEGFTLHGKTVAKDINKSVIITIEYQTDFSSFVNGYDKDDIFISGADHATVKAVPAYAVENGKLYLALINRNTLILKQVYNLENYSVDFSVEAYGAASSNYAISVNKPTLFGNYYSGDEKDHPTNAVSFGWAGHTWKFGDYIEGKDKNGKVIRDHQSKYNSVYGAVINSESKAKITGTQVMGKIQWDDPKITGKTQYINVDKIGTTASLYLDNKRSDRYDVKSFLKNTLNKEMDYETINSKGYFGIGVKQTQDQGILGLSDMTVTTSTASDLETGDLTLDGDVTFDHEKIVVNFNKNLQKISSTKIRENVTLWTGVTEESKGTKVDTSITKNGTALTIKPVGGVKLDTEYTLKIAKGFGYQMVLTLEEITKTFTRPSREGTLQLESYSESREKFVLGFNLEVEDSENIKDYVTLKQGDKNVNFNTTVKGKDLTIIPNPILSINTAYELTVKQGFGYEKVRLNEDIVKVYEFNPSQLQVSAVTAGKAYIDIEFDKDISKLSEKDIKDGIRINDNNIKDIDYTPKTDGKKVRIELNEALKLDRIYDLIISSGMGNDEVGYITADVNKYFRLKTTFAHDYSDTAKKDSDFFTLSSNSGAGQPKLPAIGVQNNKFYWANGRYSGLVVENPEIKDMKNYSLTFNLEIYGDGDSNSCDSMVLFFNRIGAAPSTLLSGTYHQWTPRHEGYGWHIDKGMVRRYILAAGNIPEGVQNATSFPYSWNIESLKPVKNTISITEKADENGDKYKEITETNPNSGTKTEITLDKKGKVGILTINGTLIDEYNAEDAAPIVEAVRGEWTVTDTGYFTLTSTGASGGAVITDFKMYEYEEITNGGATILDEKMFNGSHEITDITGVNTVNGELYVRNYNSDTESINVFTSLYDENDKLISATRLFQGELKAGETKKLTYAIDNSKGGKRIESIIMYSDCLIGNSEFSDVKIINSDRSKNILTVSGKIKESNQKRQAAFFFIESNVPNNWTTLKNTDGQIRIVDIPANASEFTFDIAFAVPEGDGVTSYSLTSRDTTPLAGFAHQKDEKILEELNNSSDSMTYDELEAVSAWLGEDLSYVQNDNQKEYYMTKIETGEYSDVQALKNEMQQIKTNILATKALKETKSYTEVNTVLNQYEASTAIDLTTYKTLTDSEKRTVCTAFEGADFEKDGVEKLNEQLNAKVAAVLADRGSSNGGNGGSSGGGSSRNESTMIIPNMGVSNNNTNTNNGKVFNDISGYAWAEEAITALYKKNIISGTGDKQFSPEDNITREQFAKIVSLAFGLYDKNAEADFEDVDKSSWAYRYIASVDRAGVMTGADNKFNPGAYITRQDISTVLYRISLKKGMKYDSTKADFKDFAKVSEYARDAVSGMCAKGILNGFEDNSFRPLENATRAQAAKIIYLMMEAM